MTGTADGPRGLYAGRAARPPSAQGAPPAGDPPYLGLATYGDSDEDAELFCGRSSEREIVIANLMAARVTVLYGPSGVGKSSLLHAGVAHELRARGTSPVILIDNYDDDPSARLTAAVRAAAARAGARAADGPTAEGGGATEGGGTAQGGAPAEASETGDGPLADAVAQLAERRAGALLIILDQFEEYLRLHPEAPGGLEHLLENLLAPNQVVARLLIGVRADRLADLDRLQERIPDVLGNAVRLDPLTPEAAHKAIVEPVKRYNVRRRQAGAGGEVTLESGLAQRLVAELGGLGEEGSGGIAPAFLSLTMRRLWDADIGERGTTLRLATLTSLGGAAHIFATHLRDTMSKLAASEQRLAADMLRFLVTPSGVTQRFSAPDLAAYTGRGEPAVQALAEKLCRTPARLLRSMQTPTGGGPLVQYELAHQVLARPAVEWRNHYETARLERRSRRLLLALVAVTAIMLAMVGYVLRPGLLGRLELHSVDARFSIRGQQHPDPAIVLVTVATNRDYDRLFGSKLPERAAAARALAEALKADPRVVVDDVHFTGSRPGSGALGREFTVIHRQRAPVVLATGTVGQNDGNLDAMLLNSSRYVYGDHSYPAVGFDGFPGNSDPGAVVRQMVRSVGLATSGPRLQTIAVVTARLAGASPASLAGAPSRTWIDFRGGVGTWPQVPFYDVFAGQPSALARLRGRVVVLGYTAPEDPDHHNTSAPGDSVMSGAELQAEAISTALRGFPLRDASLAVDVALIVLLGLISLGLALTERIWLCAVGVLAAALLFCIGAQLAFDSGTVVNVVFPLASLALSALGVLAVLIWRRHPWRTPPTA